MVEQEEQQIDPDPGAGRLGAPPPAARRRAGLALAQVPQVVERAGRGRRPLVRRAPPRSTPPGRRVGVEVLFEREGRVEHALDLAGPVRVGVAARSLRIEVHRLDHPARGPREVGVVGEEIGVSQHMRGDELVLQHRVDVEQIGPAGVGVDDQFVDLAQPVVVHRLHLLEGAPVGPVAEPARHAVGPDFVHDRRRDDLEVGGGRGAGRRRGPAPTSARSPRPASASLVRHRTLRGSTKYVAVPPVPPYRSYSIMPRASSFAKNWRSAG